MSQRRSISEEDAPLIQLETKDTVPIWGMNDPGERVYHGSIRRGEGTTIRAVVWFSDMRDFTRFSGLLERDEIISLINEVFETTECILRNHGREILKFMGDGLLGIFTTTGLAP
mmetsp:Transcript_17766/g.32117  ORF Transcript_17766/g.32117 Transcript_17766/m.32117 type:complete len:114 (-) Transcript_17766:369-710(-)